MSIIYHLKLQLLEDETSIVATLSGQHAINFFNGISPQQLVGSKDTFQLVTTAMSALTSKSDEELVWSEFILAKKLRKSIQNDNESCVVYQLTNTKLQSSLMFDNLPNSSI